MKNRFTFYLFLVGLSLCLIEKSPAQNIEFLFRAGSVSGNATGKSVTADASGNFYVTGSFSSSVIFGSTTLVSNGDRDIFIAKFSSTGSPLWARRAGGSTSDDGGGIVVSSSRVYVTGSFSGTANFPTPTVPSSNTLSSAGNNDIFVASYDASTGEVQWLRQAGGTSIDLSNGIAVDNSGVYVTGYFASTANFPTPTVPSNTLNSAGGNDIFVAKYNTSGEVQWLRRAGGSSSDLGNNITVDNSGVYVTGSFSGTANFNTPSNNASNTLASAGSFDIFVAKYDASGEVQWLRRAGSSSTEGSADIAVNSSGVYVTGYFDGTANFPTPTVPASNTLASAGSFDIFVASYHPSTGEVQWLRRAGGSDFDSGNGIAVDNSGVYVTGDFKSTANFNTPSDPASNTLSSAGGNDIFVAKYNTSGEVQWLRRGGGSSIDSDSGIGIAVDNSMVYVTGLYIGTANFNTPSNNASNTLTALGASEAFIAKWNQTTTPPTLTGFAVTSATVCTGQTTNFTATVGNVTGSYAYTLTNGTSTTTGSTTSTAFTQNWTTSGFGAQSFSLTVSANGSFTTAVTSLTVGGVISNTAINYWGGCVSSDWQTASNWSKGHVPTASEDVMLLATAPNQPNLTGAGVANSVEVPANTTLTIGSSGTLTINGSGTVNTGLRVTGTFQNNGQLRIDGTTTYGLLNVPGAPGGIVTNSGTITVGASASAGTYGVQNLSNFTNSAGGLIRIDRANEGLTNSNSGTFTNAGIITIGASASIGQYGLRNLSTFNNIAGSSITIDRVGNTGLVNISPATFNNSSSITIGASASIGSYGLYNSAGGRFNNATGGQISITNSLSVGLYNTSGSIFSNSAVVTIGASGSVGQYGLHNSAGNFINTADGQISINRASTAGLYSSSGSGTITNSGTITIGNLASVGQYGILSNGLFSNTTGGLVQIDNASLAGFFNTSSGSNQVSNSGTLTIGATVSVGSYGIQNENIFDNEPGGQIRIDRSTGTGLYNTGTFSNSANITIGASASVGQYGLQNFRSFTNSADGQINIDNSSSVGLAHYTPSQFFPFTNSGTITIGANATVGSIALGVSQANAVFTNNAGGLIILARSTTVGLDNYLSTVNNAGTIRVGALAGVGQYALRNDLAFFNNLAGGIIYLDGATDTGLLNVRFGFTNSSTILIGSVSAVGATGVSNGTATFANSGCAALLSVLSDAVITNSASGTFTNTGTIIENAGGSSSISSNAGLVLNRNGGTFTTGTGPNAPLSITGTAPTVCSPANGSFTLTGLQANTTYTLSYTLNGTPTTVSPNPVSNANGQFVLTGLGSGAYSFALSGSCVAQTLPLSGTLGNGALALTVTAAPSLTITRGNTVTLTASGATSYTWTGGSTGTTFIATPMSTITYAVTGENGSGCSSTTTVTITVNAPVCYSVVYVTQNGAGLQNGSSWANAYPGTMLQTAINSATSCSGQVWVAAGLYKPTTYTSPDSRTISFSMRNNVPIYGGFVGNETSLTGVGGRNLTSPLAGQPSSSTLSGEIGDPASTTDNSYHVLYNTNGLTATAILDGFVITGGQGAASAQIIDGSGAGMYLGVSSGSVSPQIRNCIFSDNTATYAGGALQIYISSGVFSGTITNCVFQNNTAQYSGGVSTWTFIGSQNNGVLASCRFLNNRASGTAGALGGLTTGTNSRNLMRVVNTLFQSNTAGTGGGYYEYAESGGASQVQFTNCGFLNNVASGVEAGAAYHLTYSGSQTNILYTNCSFQGNTAPTGSIIRHSTLAGGTSAIQLTNCVLFDNGINTPLSRSGAGTLTVTYSLLQNTIAPASYTSGPGNLTTTVSPFASTTSTELAPCSPAIDAGSNSATGLTGITTDLAGNPRFYSNGTVDMGAYEFQGEGLPTSFSVLGSGTATCATSPTITLSGSETGVSYQLQRNGASVGGSVPGTGLALSFGTQPQSGTYTVLASRASNNCSLVLPTSATVVSSTAVPTVSISASSGTLTCAITSVTLTATTSETALLWSNGSTTSIGTPTGITINAAGTYSVTVTNASGCTAVSNSLTISQNSTPPASPTLTASHSGTLTCAQPSLTLTASATGSGLSYAFSGSGVVAHSGNSATVNAAGGYSVTITGGNGCTTSANTTVFSNTAAPTVTLTTNQTITCVSPTVTLTATSGLTNYSFSTGQTGTSNLLTVSSAGTYSVVATGANGCTNVASTTVVSSSAMISASLVASGAISCSATSVTLTASPNNLTYSFGGGASQIGSTNSATVSSAGTYSVTVTDAAGCSAVAQVMVTGSTTAPGSPTLTASHSGTLTCAQPSLTLTASATGSGLSYAFSGPSGVVAGSENTRPVSVSGLYSVTITGSNGCTTSASTIVYSNTTASSLSVTPGSSTLTCNSPTVLLTAIGTGNVRWSTGATTSTLLVNAANIYSVTLTGSNGCTSTTSATVVSGTTAASVSITPSSGTLSCASPMVSLSAVGTGSVLWSTGASSPVISATVAGTYSVTLTNASGCTASASATVTGTVLTNVAVTADGPIGCGRTTATITIQGSGASSYTLVGPLGYSAVNGTGIFVVTAGGSYTGLASQSGCVLAGLVTVLEGGSQPTASNFRASGVLGAGSCSVSLLATATGDRYVVTGPSRADASGYVYSNVYRVVGSRELVGFMVTKPGTYTLTVYSGNCSATYTTLVSGTACP